MPPACPPSPPAPWCTLQEADELPRDFTSLFDETLIKVDVSLLPETVGLYDKLGVKKAPLRLIAPQFETPLPPLQVRTAKRLIWP